MDPALAGPAGHRGGTLRVESGPLILGLDPADVYGPLSAAYDGLLAYRRAGGPTFGTLVGDLAADVPDPSPDGRTYVFRLRPNLRYSNGAPVRPQDFRASIEGLFAHAFGPHTFGPPPPPYLHIEGASACARTPARCDLSRSIVTDASARTITLHLSAPDPDLLHYLAFPLADVIPAGSRFGARVAPPGTGPYRIAFF